MRLLLVALALAVVSCVDACGNECSFGERCVGDVLEVCGDGPDQLFNRELHELPCREPAAACVEGRSGAACVVAPPTPCDVGFVDRCEGDVLIYCPATTAVVREGATPDYVGAMDCRAIGAACGIGRDGPACIYAR